MRRHLTPSVVREGDYFRARLLYDWRGEPVWESQPLKTHDEIMEVLEAHGQRPVAIAEAITEADPGALLGRRWPARDDMGRFDVSFSQEGPLYRVKLHDRKRPPSVAFESEPWQAEPLYRAILAKGVERATVRDALLRCNPELGAEIDSWEK